MNKHLIRQLKRLFLRALPALILVASHGLLSAQPVTATWQGETGDYFDPANWDTADVPCNAGATTYDVVLPAGTYSVDLPATTCPGGTFCCPDDTRCCAVDTLTAGEDVTLIVRANVDYTVDSLAEIRGFLDDRGGEFDAMSATLPGGRFNASATLGGAATVGATSYGSTGFTSTATLLTSGGAGSALDLSSLQSLDAGYDDGTPAATNHRLLVYGGGSSTCPV